MSLFKNKILSKFCDIDSLALEQVFNTVHNPFPSFRSEFLILKYLRRSNMYVDPQLITIGYKNKRKKYKLKTVIEKIPVHICYIPIIDTLKCFVLD